MDGEIGSEIYPESHLIAVAFGLDLSANGNESWEISAD